MCDCKTRPFICSKDIPIVTGNVEGSGTILLLRLFADTIRI